MARRNSNGTWCKFPQCSHCGSTVGLTNYRGEWWCGDRLTERIEALEQAYNLLVQDMKELNP